MRDDDVIGDITQLFDSDGDDTEDEDLARACVVLWRDGACWSAVKLSQFEYRPSN